mmetsp:Transcript_118484/g.297946  ORF Transcript_118484/g.297946 Transcript_118484/m.297946 type:complete len:252 (+) Transcript_118484:168-923(+)
MGTVKVREARCAPLVGRCVAFRLVQALNLRELDQLLRAMDSRHIEDRRIVLALTSGQTCARQANGLVPGVLTQGHQGIASCLHRRPLARMRRKSSARGPVVDAAVHAAPDSTASRVHAGLTPRACVEGTCTACSNLQIELIARDIVPRVDGLGDDVLVHALHTESVTCAEPVLGVLTGAIGAHAHVDILAAFLHQAGLRCPQCRTAKGPIHAGKGDVAPQAICRAIVPRLATRPFAHHAAPPASIETPIAP